MNPTSDNSKSFERQPLSFQVVPTEQLAHLMNSTDGKGITDSIGVSFIINRRAKRFKDPMKKNFDSNKLIGVKFVLLDPYVLEITQDYADVTGTFQWEICESQVDRCLEFIKTESAKKRIFLVCSGGLGAQIAPKINDLPNLYGIYVYCGNVQYHMEWATKYSKVRIICDQDKDFLIPQLAVDVAQTNLEWATDLLQKGGDKVKAKKKLEQALQNVENYMLQNPQLDLEKEIRKMIRDCV